MAIVAAASVVWLLQTAAAFLLPLVVAALLAYGLDPVVDRLERVRVPRVLASLAVICLLVGTIGTGARLLWPQLEAVVGKIPAGATELREALRRERTDGTDSTLDKVRAAARALDSAADEAGAPMLPKSGVTRVAVQQTWRTADWLWAGSVGAVGLAGQAVVVLALTAVILMANDSFKRRLVGEMSTLGNKRLTVEILHDIERQIERFIWVQIVTCTLVGVATGLALWATGVEQPAVWGIFAGVLNVVPYFGPLIVTVILGVVAFLQFGTLEAAGLVAGLALAITTAEGLWLTPHLVSRAAALNQVAIFVAIAFWTWVWGVPGLLLAIPMLMVIKAVCDHVDGLKPIAVFLGQVPVDRRGSAGRQMRNRPGEATDGPNHSVMGGLDP
jgi:predicted PurR-regulated permease PerM